jgi:hypothetical protein
MPNDAHPLMLEQGLHDLRTHGDAADFFDIAARDRLAVRDDRQRFHQRTRILLRFLFPQATDPLAHLLPHLQAIA